MLQRELRVDHRHSTTFRRWTDDVDAHRSLPLLDRIAQQGGSERPRTWTSADPMPMDEPTAVGDDVRRGLDLPGVTADAIDLDVERNMLTVKAERRRGPCGRGPRYR
jgi:HSP20 family molecular chaperone IbpA